jgi:hypothetical protein
MQKVSDWTAKRAGGRITITGKDEKRADIKVVGVDAINSRKGKTPVAVDKNGTQYELV